MIPLVIAAHGTRLPEGVAAARALADAVRAALPDVVIRDSYVELTDPPIAETVRACLAESGRAVVVPLMLGTGGHVRSDIPEAIAAARRDQVGMVAYARHLGPDLRLRRTVRQRISAASSWEAGDTTVVFLGRGCSVIDANADHVRLARVLAEEGGYARVHPAFIQVTQPSLTESLDEAYTLGARRIVVAPNFLFPGRLLEWARDGIAAWASSHPDADVRLADVIGACDALADVVVDRYLEAASTLASGSPLYLAGLDLRDRDVLVVGAGAVAARRVPKLLDAGARVHVVAPDASPALAALADAGLLTWTPRKFTNSDLDGVWYALALTDDADANTAVARAAADRRTFCVRGDDATGGTARTPATGCAAGLSIAVLGDREPRRSANARDAAVTAVATAASATLTG